MKLATSTPFPHATIRCTSLTAINRKPAELITLYAGESDVKFVVHKEFAYFYSPVLKAAFESNFIEGQTQTYRLGDSTYRAVRVLSHWLYTQTLDTVPVEEINDRGLVQMQALLELWGLADKLLIPKLQNMAIAGFHGTKMESATVPVSCIKYIYNNAAAGSPLRLLVVDYCACFSGSGEYARTPERFPHEMLVDLVTKFAGISNGRRSEVQALKDNFAKYLVEED